MKIKKILLYSLGIICLLCLITYFAFNQFNKERVFIEEGKTVIKTDSGKDIVETIIEIEETREQPIEEELPKDLPEDSVQQVIHNMSHQKVIADEKWGFLPLTAERVERLKYIIELDKRSYQHADVYLDILNRWENKDFSQVDNDHNAIWSLQSGTIGKAKGILSIEEEKAFIKKHFKAKSKEETSN